MHQIQVRDPSSTHVNNVDARMCIQMEQEGSTYLEYPWNLLRLGSVHVSLGDRPHMEQFAAIGKDGQTDRRISPLDEQNVPHTDPDGAKPSLRSDKPLLWVLWVNIFCSVCSPFPSGTLAAE